MFTIGLFVNILKLGNKMFINKKMNKLRHPHRIECLTRMKMSGLDFKLILSEGVVIYRYRIYVIRSLKIHKCYKYM